MRHLLSAALAVLAFTPALRAWEEPPEKGKTPRERYQALFQEHQKAMQDFTEVYQKAKTQEERNKVFEVRYPKQETYAARFLKVADSAPEDPAAVDALIWVAQNGGSAADVATAVDRLAKDHAANRRMGEVAPSVLNHLVSPSAETLVRAIMEKNPDRKIKGIACLALGQHLKGQSDLLRTIRLDPKRARQIETYHKEDSAREYYAKLVRKDPDALLKEAEAAFERTMKEFGDVESGRGTLGKTAKGELYEIRNLAVGKPAPEIAGADIDGKEFKLSDYKGKVVVVDFWGDW